MVYLHVLVPTIFGIEFVSFIPPSLIVSYKILLAISENDIWSMKCYLNCKTSYVCTIQVILDIKFNKCELMYDSS